MPRWTRIFIPTSTVVIVTGLLAAWAPAAHADYRVWSCSGPNGTPLDAGAWRAGGDSGTRVDDCLAGGSLTASLPGGEVAAGATSGWRAVLPAGVTLAGGQLWLDAVTDATQEGSALTAGAATGDDVAEPTVTDGCEASGCSFGGTDPLGEANRVDVPAQAAGVAVLVRCLPGVTCNPEQTPGARVRLYRSALDVVDATPPVVDAPGGGVAATGALRGIVSVRAEVRDTGGGILRRVLLVDGEPAQTAEGTGDCALPFTRFVPCPQAQTASFDLDTRTLPDGTHAVAVRAVDAGGLSTDGATRSVVVDNAPAAATPPPAGAVAGQSTTGHAATTPTGTPSAVPIATRVVLPARVALPSRSPVTGRVYDGTGRRVGGAKVALVQRPLGRPKVAWKPIGIVETDGEGRFTVPTGGASRLVRAYVITPGSMAEPADLELVEGQALRLRGPAATLRNGDEFTLRGRLSGRGASAPGTLVVVQAVVRGRWRAVDTLRAGVGGAVRWRYRLRHSVRDADYRFRLRVPDTSAMPWAEATSDAIVVRVRR